MKIKILLTAAAILGLMNTAYAADIYKTGFENPPFVADSVLLGQDGWSTAIPPFLNPNAATITNLVAKSGKQSVEVQGADLVSSGGLTGPYDAIGSYRWPVNYDSTNNDPIVRIDADLQLKTDQAKTPGEFFSLTLGARSGNGEGLGEIGLSSQGIVEAWEFNAPGGGAPLFTRAIRFNKWYHIKMLIDFKQKILSYFINDTFLGSVSTAASTSTVLLRGAMVVYARPDGGTAGGSGSNRANYTALFDNFRISKHKAMPD